MEALDTIASVGAKKSGEKSPEPRRHTIPIYGDEYEWWTIAVRRQIKVKGIDQKTLADQLDVDGGTLSRCINREVPTYELLIAISDALAVAYPVLLPTSESQAIRLAEEKRVLKRTAKVKKIKAGVPDSTAGDQGGDVVSEHASRYEAEARSPSPRRKKSLHAPG